MFTCHKEYFFVYIETDFHNILSNPVTTRKILQNHVYIINEIWLEIFKNIAKYLCYSNK